MKRHYSTAIALAYASFLFPMSSAWADSAKLTFNGHSYQRFDTAMNWTAAKTFCENKGTHLATITSQAENDFLAANFSSSYMWLGASDSGQEGVWKWVTGETWSYSNWIVGQPDNGGSSKAENYLTMQGMSGKSWNDLPDTGYWTSAMPVVPLCEWDGTTTISTPTLTLSTPYGTSAGSPVTLSISPAQTGATYKFCISSVSQIVNLGCQEVLSSSISIPLQPTWDYYLTAKTIVNGVESGLSNEVHVVTTNTNDKLKYPVILVHGLDSNHATWKNYGDWIQKGIAYGGTLAAIDSFHATTTGNYSNTNLPSKNSQAGCPEYRDITKIYDVRYYFGCNPQGGYFTMNFSNNTDLSFAAQAMELRAIVDAVTALTEAKKVFLVGHSMGGLASRAYIQYLGGGDKVAGVITIGTPHQGALTDTYTSTIASITSLLSADVKTMLFPYSIDLRMLNDLTNNPWNLNVKNYALALNNQLSGVPSDDIVTVDSQCNNYLWTCGRFEENHLVNGHTNETSSVPIRDEVFKILTNWSK